MRLRPRCMAFRHAASTSSGASLPDLLVALAVASGLVVAVFALLDFTALRTRDTRARLDLEDTARAALDLLEVEVRGAGGYADASPAVAWSGVAPLGAAAPPGLATGGGCLPALAHDLTHPVQAIRRGTADPWPLGCAPGPSGRAMQGSDLLVVRSSPSPATAGESGVLWTATTPVAGALRADRVAIDASITGAARLQVSAFYVSQDATAQRGLPSLRRKRLVGGAAGPRFEDEELVAGVEQLRVTLEAAGAEAAGRVLTLNVRVRAARRVTSPLPATLLVDGEAVPIPTDGYPRAVFRRTVHLRNAAASAWSPP